MNELLNVDQIKAIYPSEWVLIGDPEVTTALEIVCGRVLFHSPNADEVYRKAAELRRGRFATVFTGEIPADTEFALLQKLDDGQSELCRSEEFWRFISERREEPTMSRGQLEAALSRQ